MGANLLLILLVCWGLSTCGASTPALEPSAALPSPTVTVPIQMPVVLTLHGYFDPETLPVLDEQILNFEQLNADVKVAVLQGVESVVERRLAFAESLAAGDTRSDLYLLQPEWVAEFGAQGWLLPLDKYRLAESKGLDEPISRSAQGNTPSGELVALSSNCFPDKAIAVSAHSLHPEEAFRFLVSLLDCGQ